MLSMWAATATGLPSWKISLGTGFSAYVEACWRPTRAESQCRRAKSPIGPRRLTPAPRSVPPKACRPSRPRGSDHGARALAHRRAATRPIPGCELAAVGLSRGGGAHIIGIDLDLLEPHLYDQASDRCRISKAERRECRLFGTDSASKKSRRPFQRSLNEARVTGSSDSRASEADAKGEGDCRKLHGGTPQTARGF